MRGHPGHGPALASPPGHQEVDLVGAENPVTSRDLQILVYEAAEPISTQRSDRRAGAWGSGVGGRALMQRSVRTVGVVVLDELT
jgi:hypothetical protein